MRQFFDFIQERQNIWHNKEILKLPTPWTNDPILQTYKFCNVFRKEDKCTKHLMQHVISTSLPVSDKIFNILLYRRFNTADFFDKCRVKKINDFSFNRMEIQMDIDKLCGIKLFNSAYIICQVAYDKKYRKSDKHVQQLLLMQDYGKSMATAIAISSWSGIKELTEFLTEKMPLTGKFLAYQYALDISYLKEFQFNDMNEWCDVGPGAIGTIDHIFGKQKNQLEYMNRCIEIYKVQDKYLTNWKWQKIGLSDIENICCEYRKYFNLKNQPKARKRYYKQGANNGLQRA